jgi:predicted RNase H-like nuclease (RuvC/YqgF family)
MNEQQQKLHDMLSDPEFQKLPYLDQTMNIYKLIEEKDKRIQEMESWYDQALDWREWEVEQSEKRIAVLEASLNDVKNQVEQVRKETAEDILGSLVLSDDNKDMRH